MIRSRTQTSIVLLVAGLLVGCGGSSSTPPGNVDVGTAAPDFALQDVNDASPTAAQTVSPRDFLAKVSAYYFGHAT